MKCNTPVSVAVVLLSMFVAGIYGWVLNILALVHFQGGISQAGFLEVLRVIGVFMAPLGSILGLFV